MRILEQEGERRVTLRRTGKNGTFDFNNNYFYWMLRVNFLLGIVCVAYKTPKGLHSDSYALRVLIINYKLIFVLLMK